MARVRNIHGQGRFVNGDAAGEVFVDFGELTDDRYVRVRVQADERGQIEVRIDGEMCAGYNDAPSMRILINDRLVIDTSDGQAPQPQQL